MLKLILEDEELSSDDDLEYMIDQIINVWCQPINELVVYVNNNKVGFTTYRDIVTGQLRVNIVR